MQRGMQLAELPFAGNRQIDVLQILKIVDVGRYQPILDRPVGNQRIDCRFEPFCDLGQ
jgi:hypothetical protein